jgi:topoisomerase IA-like protein
MERLKRGEYCLGELVEKKENRDIGEYEGIPVVLKTGPYGYYVEHGKKKISMKDCEGKEVDEIFTIFVKQMDIEKGITEEAGECSEETNKNMIRELTSELSIRKGRFGAYIYYQTSKMKKPKFFALKGFKTSYRLCQKEILMDWIREKYSIG